MGPSSTIHSTYIILLCLFFKAELERLYLK